MLVTADKDFGELVFRQGAVHTGVVLLRLAGLQNVTKGGIVAEPAASMEPNSSARSPSSRLARFGFVAGYEPGRGVEQWDG